MLQRFMNWIALTRTEQRVILFLTATLVAGAGIRLYQETSPPGRNFDYRPIDSSFASFRDRLASDTGRQGATQSGRLLNINQASKSELVALPGVGETLADRIVLYRGNKGKFSSVDDLQKIKGISKKKLEKLKPYVTVH
jgi:comEA protein